MLGSERQTMNSEVFSAISAFPTGMAGEEGKGLSGKTEASA